MDELQIVSYCRLQDLCTKLKKMSKEEKDRLHIRDDLVTGESEVECFIDEMNTFYQVIWKNTQLGERFVSQQQRSGYAVFCLGFFCRARRPAPFS